MQPARERGATPEGSLELTGLRRSFGDVAALDDLSFTVRAGQVFGFLGPNGAGKTTAMRAIVGLVTLDGGEVRWRGRPIGERERREIGYMPEERGLYPAMRVAAHLEYLARLHGLDRAAARAAAGSWIDRLGLGGHRDARIESLSLGNQQRVQLAAALVHGPELLILDEPFSSLDPSGVDSMSQVLAERAAAGVTMLFSSHQLDLVEHLCEAVAIIHHGRLVAAGTVADLAAGGPLAVLVRVTGDEQARWARTLPADAVLESVRAGTARIRVASPATAQAVLDVARGAGPVEHFAFARRRLSEVFRDVVGAPVEEFMGGDGDPVAAGAARRQERP